MQRFVLILALMAIASAVSASSIFSRYGMAEEYEGIDTYGLGMGGTGYSDLFRTNAGYGNPSLAATTNTVLFSSAFSTGYYTFKDKSGSSFRDDGAFFPGFAVMVPYRDQRFGFYGHLLTGGNLENRTPTTVVAGGDTLSLTEIHRLQANVFQADLFYAWANPVCNVGLAFNFYVGHRFSYAEQNFDSSLYMDTKYEIGHYFQNPGFTVGLSRKFDNLSVGMVYASKARLIGESDYTSIFDHEATDDGEYTLPHRIDLGVTARFDKQFKASLEGGYSLWSDTDYQYWPAAEGSDIDIRNTARVAFGLAYDPQWKNVPWLERIPLRMGVQYRQLPFEPNGDAIDETTFSGGFSIPLSTPQKQVNLAFQYTLRGNPDTNGYGDRSFLISVSAVGFDLFSKRKNRIEHRDIPMPDESAQ